MLPINCVIISCAINAPAHHLPRGNLLVLKHRHTLMHVHETLLPEDIGLVNAILHRYVMLSQILHRSLVDSRRHRAIEEGLMEHVDEVDYNLYAVDMA